MNIAVLCFVYLLSTTSSFKSFPSINTTKFWSENLDNKFLELTNGNNDITGATSLQFHFNKNFNGTILKPNGTSLIKNMKLDIERVFRHNIDALENLKNTAEITIKNSVYDSNIELSDVKYHNVNKLDDIEKLSLQYSHHYKQTVNMNKSGVHIPIEKFSLQYSHHYKQTVNMNKSGVHIPIEIFEGYREIVNEIKWTSNLDKMFLENHLKYPEVYTQLLGTEKGLMRLYPLSKWNTIDDKPDLYDVRRRPWYINGATSPKDVLILMDTSGSMHGKSFNIMKIAAQTLVNTLGENDYFNVVQFNKDVSWVSSCLDTLVQCNRRNKRIIFDGINHLTTRFQANSTRAIEFAFQAFEKFDKDSSEERKNIGANCHRLIFILSDGGIDYPQNVMKHYLNSNTDYKNTRIFSYAIGSHYNTPTDALRKLACRTRGSFETISHIGEVRTKVHRSYMKVISRPLVLSAKHQLKYSSIYQDAIGLGIMVTATLPVFNASTMSNNQSLAGIVGIDIPLSKLESFAPKHQLGALGYTFGINTNGYVTFHPRYTKSSENYLDDPVNHDFVDIEGNSADLLAVRDDMVTLANVNNGSEHQIKTVRTHTIQNLLEGHTIPVHANYYYSGIIRGQMSISLVIPTDHFYAVFPYNDQDLQIRLRMLKGKAVKLAPWNYCNETNSWHRIDTMENLQLSNKTCRGERVSHLMWDIQMMKYFEELDFDSNNPNYRSRFLFTDGGLIVFRPKEAEIKYSVDPYQSLIYRKSVASKKPVIVAKQNWKFPLASTAKIKNTIHHYDAHYISISEQNHNKYIKDQCSRKNDFAEKMNQVKSSEIYLASSIKIEENGKIYQAGVSGIELSPQYLQDILLNATWKNVYQNEYNCYDLKSIQCYIIDYSGHVLASNQALEKVLPGEFLGQFDPGLMRHLVEEKQFFSEDAEYNYEDICVSRVDCAFKAEKIKDSELPGGCHRCTSKQYRWTFKEHLFTKEQFSHSDVFITKTYKNGEISNSLNNDCIFNSNIEHQTVDCEFRNYYLYIMKSLQGIFIAVESAMKSSVHEHMVKWKGLPTEILGDNCLLPSRFRIRPVDCFKHNTDEINDCELIH